MFKKRLSIPTTLLSLTLLLSPIYLSAGGDSGAGAAAQAADPGTPSLDAKGSAGIQTGDVHVKTPGHVLMTVQGGNHNYHSHEGPDYTDSGSNTTIESQMASAAKHGFLSGIAQVVAALVAQVPIAVASKIVSTIVEKIAGNSTDTIERNTILLKHQLDSYNSMCGQGQQKTQADQANCAHMRAQIQAMLVIHGERMKAAMEKK